MASTLPTPRPETSSATPRPNLTNSTPSPRESDDQRIQQHSTEQKQLPLKPPIHEVLPKEGFIFLFNISFRFAQTHQ